MDNNKIGKFISTRRKELGLTQQNLADKLFVTDKAISKWERGINLPDITLLDKLSKILNVDIKDILTGEIGSNKQINIEEDLARIKKELSEANKKKKNKFIIIVIILLILIIYILLRNMSLGYNIKSVNYSNREINIGVPKTSFIMKHNDKSYSYKNLRNSHIVENEIKKYLKTLKYSSCNDTIYYYNESDNFSIINYSVKNHIIYNTISYQIVDNDYCFSKTLNEYSEKLNGLRRFHNLGSTSISFEEEWDNLFVIHFVDGGTNPDKIYEFVASMQVIYLKRKDKTKATTHILEDSNGTFEIKDNKLYYYRTEIKEKSNDINIPEVSTFIIEEGKLKLTNNYFKKYYNKEIILK